jgi:UDP-glucose 4-epimerase
MPVVAGAKFVVLGGASQVGSHIGEQLLAGGAREVVLLDNLSLGSAETLQPLLADRRCSLVRADVLRLNELFDPLAGADGVFGVAAYMATSIGENPWAGMDVNIRGVQNTLEACRYQGVKKIVFSSSTGVYGDPQDDPTGEDSPLRWQALPPPMALYCASKVVGEGLARLYQQRYGTDFVALRYTAVYGERQHRRALVGGHIADACERIRRGEPPFIDGDGRQVHDYVYAGDVARANLMAMESPVTGEGINICSGVATSQNRIVEIALKACGSDLKPQLRQGPAGAKLPAASRQAYSRDKARRLLGWEPRVSIEEGIGKVLAWVDRQREQAAAR